ncbi:unnamed protein product [Thelazia callipaeda]|uniref:CUPID domain-containing protein n=1 Tax=Thelazia callipaeda TaxID=103827 RepID=A0A0N5CL82_THECL|nr:unnamed protein product [Thelazia callipaeda]
MGRRKLPSIPTQRAEKVSKTLPVPVYLTSSSPVAVSSTFDRQYHSQDYRICSRATSGAASLTELSLPSSSSSSHCRTKDPAILPGAVIVNTKYKLPLRQTTSAASCSRSSVLSQPSGTKLPSLLARVLLKKELKEVLKRRRESLEACEIEANQRQYVVHRMLITGLLPEYRPADIDNIPNVIPCLLPLELISGARVVPSEVPTTTTSVTTSLVPKCDTMQSGSLSVESSTHEIGISTDDLYSESHLKSVGVQSENLPATTVTNTAQPSSVYHYVSVASLRQQVERDHLGEFISNTDSASAKEPKFRSTETQTNGAVSYDSYSTLSTPHRHLGSTNNQFSASEPNLLESTAKYFAEYDRQLREHGRRLKNRFAFSDDDSVNREARTQKVMDELAQRKEKISSMINLYSPSTFPTIHPSSDYSSTVPHYGSLPRIDFPTTHSPRSIMRDYANVSRSRTPFGYGSLPRNYERYISRNYEDIQRDYLHSPPMPTRPYDAHTSSWNELNSTIEEDFMQDPRMRPYTASSANRSGSRFMYNPPSGSRGSTRPAAKVAYDDLYTPHYLRNSRVYSLDGPQSLPNTDFVSQYANYLSNQFITDQQKLVSNYPKEEQTYFNQVKKQPYVYNSVLNNQTLSAVNYQSMSPSGNSLNPPSIHPHTAVHYPNIPNVRSNVLSYVGGENWPWYHHFPYPNNGHVLIDRTLPYARKMDAFPESASAVGQVYSRNDANYGSRPLHYASEYGNYYRNRADQRLWDSSNRYVKGRHPYVSYAGQYHPNNRFVNVSEQQVASSSQPSVLVDNYSRIRHRPGYTTRAWSSGNIPTSSYDAIYPRQDSSNRLYGLNNQRSFHPHYYGNEAI